MKYNNFKKGTAGSMLALALMTTVPVPQVEAATTQELQAQIQSLLTQIQNLKVNTVTTASTCAPFTFDLNVGRSGVEVTNLQKFLIGRGYSIPAGASGFFGEQTRIALSQFQSQSGVSPAVGYFGPMTRAKVNALCSISSNPLPNPGNQNPNNGNGNQVDNQPGSILRGEGELDTVKIEDADDPSIREAAADAPIAVVTLEARDGDIEISRMDIALVAANSNVEKDPWDVFENISLWIDGEKISEQRIDNRSLYTNRNSGTIRFSNLDVVLEEDEEVEMTIAVSPKNRVAGSNINADWGVSVNNIRYKDADNVITTDTTTGDLKDSVGFSIVQRGDGEELRFSVGNTNPIERTIVVDESKKTNNVTLLNYTIEALGNDIELDTLFVTVETGNASFSDVVADVKLKIGNTTFKKDAVVTSGSYSTTSALVSFDIDNKIKIKKDKKVTIEVVVDLKSQTNYQNGENISAKVTSVERDQAEAEGADDVKSFSGTVIGKIQTLIAQGVVAPVDSVRLRTETFGNNNTIGVFTIEFAVTAVENDFYITDKTSTSSLSSLGGVQYTVDSTVGDPDAISATLSSSADEVTNGVFVIREGQSQMFTLTVTVDASAAGSHRVVLDAIRFSENTDGVTDGTTYNVIPVQKFRTPYQFINN